MNKPAFYLTSFGMFLLATTIVHYIYENIVKKRFSMDSSKMRGLYRRKEMMKRYRYQFTTYLKGLNRKEQLLIIGITIMMVSMADKIESMSNLLLIGIVLGFTIVVASQKTKMQISRTKRVKELAILAETIELYVKSGYTLLQAIKTAKILTPYIQPQINKCINYWPSGAVRALDQLQIDLGVPEAQTVCEILKHIELSGLSNAAGILESESENIERLQKHKSQRKIASKPIYFMIYRILPFAAVSGIVAGSLVYKTMKTLAILNNFSF